MMGQVLVFLVVLLGVAPAWAGNTHGTPDVAKEQQAWWGDAQQAYAVSGCFPATFAGTTLPTMPCAAYVTGASGELVYVTQPTKPIGPLNVGDGTYWVALHRDISTAVAGWTRQAGTHYLWRLGTGTTQPATPSNALMLFSVTMTSSAIVSPLTVVHNRQWTTAATLPGSLTVGANATWRWATAGGVATVPSGATLTFASCPQAGRWQIWDADASATGSVRFTVGACGGVSPEWWGADPTGVVDSTTFWVDTIAAAADRVPITCEGQYLLSATAGTVALLLPDGTQIVGTYRKGNPGAETFPCKFLFDGGGSAMGTTDTGSSYNDLRLENLYIEDVDNDSEYGLKLNDPQSITLNNVNIRNFDVGVLLNGFFYYGYLRQLKTYNQRTYCLEVVGPVNSGEIDIQCSGTDTGITTGVIVGLTGSFSTSQNLKIKAVVEIAGGTPISIARVRNLDLQAYVEHPGNDADYGQTSVLLSRIRGGRANLFLLGNTGDAATITQGLYLPGTAGVSSDDVGSRDLVITGHAKGYTSACVVIEKEEGMWGIDLTGFACDDPTKITLGDFSTGALLGQNYVTHGVGPGADEGRGCTKTECASDWLLGDLIHVVSAGKLTNTMRQVTVAGNPPSTSLLILPTATSIILATGDATPTVRTGNTYHTSATVANTTGGDDITNFDDAQEGQTLIVQCPAANVRTITGGATIVLASAGASFVMGANDTISFQYRSGVWYETGRSVNH